MSLEKAMLKAYCSNPKIFDNGFIIDVKEKFNDAGVSYYGGNWYFENEKEFKESGFPKHIQYLGCSKTADNMLIFYCI